MSNVDTLFSVLPEAPADLGPEWVQMVPAGTFSAVDGRGPYHLRNPQAVIAASMVGENPRLAVDENHSTDTAGKQGHPSPARGWITRMEARADGLYGLVEWTASGKALRADKAYRGVSPVFRFSKDGTVERVLRLALTNDPALIQLRTLHHRQEDTMDIAALRKTLRLPDTADEAAVLAAVTAAASGQVAQLAAIATAAGVTAADAPGLVEALRAQRAASGDVAQLANKVVQLETLLATVNQQTRQTAAVAFVDAQIKAGKPVNALRDHYIARHVADAAAVEKELGAMVSINAGGLVVLAAKNLAEMSDDDMMSAEDRDICAKMGLDPKKFAANKRKMAGMPAGGAKERDGAVA